MRLNPAVCALLIACLSTPLAYSQTTLGRLFSSEDERTALDLRRREQGSTTPPKNDRSGDAARKNLEERVTLDGYVHRKRGKSTTWINQIDQYDKEMPQGIIVLEHQAKPPTLPLLLPSGQTVYLKPGQTLDVLKGKIREGSAALPNEAPKQDSAAEGIAPPKDKK